MSLSLLTHCLLQSELSPLVWIGVSIALKILVAHLAWWLRPVFRGLPGRITAAYRGWCLWPLATGLARLTYYLGIPYAALILGVLPASTMGLALPRRETDWLGWLLLGFGALLILIPGWVHFLRATGQLSAPLPGPFATQMQTLASPWGWGILVREVAYLQAHWGFYRGALIWFLGDTYWGSWLSLALVGLEAWANPATRSALNRPGQGQASLLTASLAVIATVAFILTHNLWLTAALHAIILLTLLGFLVLMGRRTTTSAPVTAADGSTAIRADRLQTPDCLETGADR